MKTMTDQAPELLPQVSLPRWWLERIRDGLFAMDKLPSGALGDWAFLFREQLKDALEARPSSERPVDQAIAQLERPEAPVAVAMIERSEFEIVRKASRLFEDAANAWMERALKAEAALAIQHEEPGRETMTSVPGDDGHR